MKKKWILYLCVLLTFGLSFPVVKDMTNLINAAGTMVEPIGNKVIDFDVAADGAYAVDEDKYLYDATRNKLIVKQDGTPLIGVKKISAAEHLSYESKRLAILLENDEVYTMDSYSSSPVLLNTGLSNIADIECAKNNIYLVMADGSVYANGDNSYGQLGNNNGGMDFVRLDISNVIKVSAHKEFATALKQDGTVYMWGKQVVDGEGNYFSNVSTPMQLNFSDNNPVQNAVDIDIMRDNVTQGFGVAVLVVEDNTAKGYLIGYKSNGNGSGKYTLDLIANDIYQASNIRNGYAHSERLSFLADNKMYTIRYPSKNQYPKLMFDDDVNIIKMDEIVVDNNISEYYLLTESGALFYGVGADKNNFKQLQIGDRLKVKAFKSDDTVYVSEKKYNGDIDIETSTSESSVITCKVQDPVGSTEIDCTDFQNNEIHINLQNDRIYRKYLFTDTKAEKEFIVDLYKGTPKLGNYSTSGVNKIKITDSISLDVPADQTNWNIYTATVTDSSNQTKDFSGGTLSKGLYTLHVTDEYGNKQDYQFEVTDKPNPTADFNLTSSNLTYGDYPTKVNNIIGTFTLSYPVGEPISNIKTIQLGNSGDESHFSIETSGNLKVKGADLDTGTYSVTVSGTDGNDMAFTKTVSITVNKRKTIVKPKDVTKTVGQAFKDNGVTYNPQPIAGDSLGTPIITSKYPLTQQAGRYTDGIQVTGLTNPNYDFEYQEGTLVINDKTLPNNGSGYYKIEGTKGKNNWYVSDIKISTLNKDGYDLISSDGITFGTTPLIYQTDGDYPITFYLKNSTTGIIAKGINYQVKIDQTPPTVPTLTMNQLNTSRMARLINFLSFGNWMNTGAEVVMSSSDETSGIDNYSYVETDIKGTSNTKTSTSGKVTYQNDVEINITAKACDKAGNCSNLSASETLMIDRKGPEITGVKDQGVYKYYYLPRFVNIKDSGSGLSYAEYKKDGVQAGTIQEDIDERIDGEGKYEIYAIDNAGNESTLSFEIVPLPDIEDIDGSDESKDIIDQVKDEYEEVKDNLTDEERKEYEDWIKDAEDKWESERKKVVETDDKSAKVEGQGDTTFDPNTVLIVDDISDRPIPPLPKQANVVYDVYLKKGNTQIQPNGEIKVYLPITDIEDPIVYSIDGNGNIKEIEYKKENGYITFITDKLTKYAIADKNSKTLCELNGIEINIDTDGDGLPDINLDLDGDCIPDINIDVNGDRIPDIDIDTTGDGKPNINIDTDKDGKADLNVILDIHWKPDVTYTVNGFTYNTMKELKPYLNIDDDNDGQPDRNIDANHDGIIDDSENNRNIGGVLGSANTSDHTKWILWWIMFIISSILMVFTLNKNKKHS